MVARYFDPQLLAGKVALVTGASSGIGAASAIALGAAGARVIVSGRDEARLFAVAEQLVDAVILPISLEVADASERLAIAAEEKAGKVDILINCAGFGLIKNSQKLTAEDIDRTFALNVRAPLLLSGILSKGMAARRAGSIVNMSSVVGSYGTAYQAAYAASKGALEAMTRSLAREYGPSGIRVNAIAPGLVATEMWGNALEHEWFVEGAAEYTALRVWGKPEAIADGVVFLASDAASYITGEILHIDGGLSRTGDIVPPASQKKKIIT